MRNHRDLSVPFQCDAFFTSKTSHFLISYVAYIFGCFWMKSRKSNFWCKFQHKTTTLGPDPANGNLSEFDWFSKSFSPFGLGRAQRPGFVGIRKSGGSLTQPCIQPVSWTHWKHSMGSTKSHVVFTHSTFKSPAHTNVRAANPPMQQANIEPSNSPQSIHLNPLDCPPYCSSVLTLAGGGRDVARDPSLWVSPPSLPSSAGS